MCVPVYVDLFTCMYLCVCTYGFMQNFLAAYCYSTYVHELLYYCRYIEEHVLKTGVAIETQGFAFVTSGKKRESLTVSICIICLCMVFKLLHPPNLLRQKFFPFW